MTKDNNEKPIIFKEGEYTEKEIGDFKNKQKAKLADIYFKQLREFFEIKNIHLSGNDFEKEFLKFKKEKIKKRKTLCGDWIYYSWNNVFVHTLAETENDELRTNRNKNIITGKEQEKLADFTIAIAGLSVGGNIATTLLYNGFPKKIKLADFDTLATSNLNRVRGKLSDVGLPKITITNRQIYELDPYASIVNFEEGINKKNINEFVSGSPKPKLIFEIIDGLETKILIRKEAKKNRIPVVMLTCIGDSVLIDVERYDTDGETRIFNGAVNEDILDKILSGGIKDSEKNKYVVKIVGAENIPERVMNSVKSIGKSLVGRPQLMSTVTVASGLASFIARKIALGEPVLSGRTLVKFDDFLNERSN